MRLPSSPLKIGANRSRCSWVMIGHPNKKHKLQLYKYKDDIPLAAYRESKDSILCMIQDYSNAYRENPSRTTSIHTLPLNTCKNISGRTYHLHQLQDPVQTKYIKTRLYWRFTPPSFLINKIIFELWKSFSTCHIFRAKFDNFGKPQTFPGVMWVALNILVSISSTVFTFVGRGKIWKYYAVRASDPLSCN